MPLERGSSKNSRNSLASCRVWTPICVSVVGVIGLQRHRYTSIQWISYRIAVWSLPQSLFINCKRGWQLRLWNVGTRLKCDSPQIWWWWDSSVRGPNGRGLGLEPTARLRFRCERLPVKLASAPLRNPLFCSSFFCKMFATSLGPSNSVVVVLQAATHEMSSEASYVGSQQTDSTYISSDPLAVCRRPMVDKWAKSIITSIFTTWQVVFAIIAMGCARWVGNASMHRCGWALMMRFRGSLAW